MTIRHLKIFIAVCEEGGITKASKVLHIAQPSVSFTISEMEKYYKIKLFERINQRLILTEIGKTLLIKAKEIIRNFEEFEHTAIEGGERPTLHIGSSLTLGKTVLPKILKKIKEEIPEIILHVTVDSTSVIEKETEKCNLDFAIVEGKLLSANLNTYEFGHDKLIAVCKSDFPIKDEVTLEELISYPLILRECGSASREQFEKVLLQSSLSAKPFFESVSNECITVSLMEGLGVSLLPEGIVAPLLNSKELKEIKVSGVDFTRTHYIGIHKNKRLNKAQKKALSLCLNFYNDL